MGRELSAVSLRPRWDVSRQFATKLMTDN